LALSSVFDLFLPPPRRIGTPLLVDVKAGEAGDGGTTRGVLWFFMALFLVVVQIYPVGEAET
jgi:hypothetical protein